MTRGKNGRISRPGVSAIVLVLGFLVCPFFAYGTPAYELLVSSRRSNSILRFNPETREFLGTLVAPGSGGLLEPEGMLIGPDGLLYVIQVPLFVPVVLFNEGLERRGEGHLYGVRVVPVGHLLAALQGL